MSERACRHSSWTHHASSTFAVSISGEVPSTFSSSLTELPPVATGIKKPGSPTCLCRRLCCHQVRVAGIFREEFFRFHWDVWDRSGPPRHERTTVSVKSALTTFEPVSAMHQSLSQAEPFGVVGRKRHHSAIIGALAKFSYNDHTYALRLPEVFWFCR